MDEAKYPLYVAERGFSSVQRGFCWEDVGE